MKKTLALLIAMLLLCVLTLAGAETTLSTSEICGKWNMTRYSVGGQMVEDPVAAGSTKIIVFREDGTAEVTINTNVYGASWMLEGNTIHLLYDDGDKADFAVQADGLVYTTSNQVQYFVKDTSINDGELLSMVENAVNNGLNINNWKTLGYNYSTGNGVEQDYAKSLEYYLLAAEAGDAESQYWVGYSYRYGVGTDVDLEKAAYWLEKAANKFHVVATEMLGEMYYFGEGKEQDYDKAFDCFKIAADAGDDWAMAYLGRCYQFGYGVQQDADLALQCFQKSADMGCYVGFDFLGTAYANGVGTEKDYTKAEEYLKIAAQEGSKSATQHLLFLAADYLNGENVKQDVPHAVELIELATSYGNVTAMKVLAQCYYIGMGVDVNEAKAKELWRAAGLSEAEIAEEISMLKK